MGIQKDVKTAWRDSKVFADKHPVVAGVIVLAAAYTFANIYFTSYVMTKAFEKGME